MSVVEPQGDFQSRGDIYFFLIIIIIFLNGWSHQCDLRIVLVAPLRNSSRAMLEDEILLRFH